MKKVSCKDINPDSSCDFEATGSNTKEAVDKMMSHVKSEHKEDIEGMSDKEVRTMIEVKVHE